MNGCFCYFKFSNRSTSQEIGWKECLKSDTFCDELDINDKTLIQSVRCISNRGY